MSRAILTRPAFRLLVSVSLFLAVLAFTDLSAVQQHFQTMRSDTNAANALGWIALAVLATFPQYLLSAHRWQLTAAQLDLDLPYVKAVKAYYKATFFNQVLPGGVLGDVSRAIEHGKQGSTNQRSSAWRAVAIERLAGQLVLVMAVLVTLPFVGAGSAPEIIPAAAAESSSIWWYATLMLSCITLTIAASVVAIRFTFMSRMIAGIQIFATDMARAWLTPGLLAWQLLLSLAILACYLLSYAALAQAFGFDGNTLWLSSAILLVLLSMSLPISVAGWGVREASAAGLWLAGGQDPAAGVAIAVAYGLLNLACSLPGLWFMLHQRRAD